MMVHAFLQSLSPPQLNAFIDRTRLYRLDFSGTAVQMQILYDRKGSL